MSILAKTIPLMLPFLALIILILGISKKRMYYVLISLWVSLATLILQYQKAGNEILGPYFGYQNATLYTLSLLCMLIAFLYWATHTLAIKGKMHHYSITLLFACMVTGSVLLMINVWINAQFIETKLPGTAIMQVTSFTPPSYCKYRYVFYKINANNNVSYLCPNHYGLVPSTGHLEVAPDFIAKQLIYPAHIKKTYLKSKGREQNNKN